MAAIVYQKDKRSGITYAYESISFWDKEKKQSRAHRTLIGRVDSITGEIVPTDGRNRKKTETKSPLKQDKSAIGFTRRTFFWSHLSARCSWRKIRDHSRSEAVFP